MLPFIFNSRYVDHSTTYAFKVISMKIAPIFKVPQSNGVGSLISGIVLNLSKSIHYFQSDTHTRAIQSGIQNIYKLYIDDKITAIILIIGKNIINTSGSVIVLLCIELQMTGGIFGILIKLSNSIRARNYVTMKL